LNRDLRTSDGIVGSRKTISQSRAERRRDSIWVSIVGSSSSGDNSRSGGKVLDVNKRGIIGRTALATHLGVDYQIDTNYDALHISCSHHYGNTDHKPEGDISAVPASPASFDETGQTSCAIVGHVKASSAGTFTGYAFSISVGDGH